jgi:predicted transcriptional regulator
MGKAKEYDPPTSVRFDPRTLGKLKKIGEEEGDRSVGSIVKQAVQEFIDRREGERRRKK